MNDFNNVEISEDEYLLQKVVPLSKITRIIYWRELGITPEYIREQSQLKLSGLDDDFKFIDKREHPTFETAEEAQDRFYVTELCMPYNPPPDDDDIFVYYHDIAFLSGSAGYLRIRKGYVVGQKVVVRS